MNADFKAAKVTSNSTSSLLAAVTTISILKVSGDIILDGTAKTSADLWASGNTDALFKMKSDVIVIGNETNQ